MRFEPVYDWVCPSCSFELRLTSPKTPSHACPALAGLEVFLAQKGIGARHRVVEREDYVGTEEVQTDGEGRPVMAVYVDRPDGSNDCTMYAPTARATATGHSIGGR